MINLFESNHNEIGSIDKNLILKTKGRIRILWNKKFIELLDNDGNINCGLGKIIKSVTSPDLINKDGFYFYDGNLIAYVGGTQITLSSESGNTFVSFLVEQDTTPELKITAQKNIGFYADTKNDINITNGIVYVEDEKTMYIVNNGQLSKFEAEFPNPYPKQFVITKEDLNSEGSLVITGQGINNSLAFDNLFIYSDLGAVYRSNLHKFVVNNNIVALITGDGIITEQIGSEGANTNNGYRIYNNRGKYILDIDTINVRDGLSISPKIYPLEYYKNQNVITKVKETTDSSGNPIVKCYLKYENTYKPGDKILVFDSDLNKVELTVVDSVYDPVTKEGYITTRSDGIYEGMDNIRCDLIDNDLVIGEIGNVYNLKDVGLISKQTILYSAKFDKDGTGDKIYPFYSDELYNELSSHIEEYDNVIPPLGLIKKLELVHSAEYNEGDIKIYFKDYSGKTIDSIDAKPFVKDGMVESAKIVGNSLVISFNEDANKDDIVLPLSAAFDLRNYYTKQEVDSKLNEITLYVDNSNYVSGDDIYGITVHKVSELENDAGYITKNDLGDLLPLGSIILWGFSGHIPEGWHICDGSTLSPAGDYLDFSSTFGTLTLPDLRGKFPVGYDSSDSDFSPFAKTGGEKEHTLTDFEMPKHHHEYYSDGTDVSGSPLIGNRIGNDEYPCWGDSNYSTAWKLKTNDVGYDNPQSFGILPPYFALNFIMKVKNINKVKETLTDSEFGFTSNSCKVTSMSSVSPPALINTHNLPVTYSSTNPSKATVNGGSLSINSNGVCMIIAYFRGDDKYNPSSSSYTLEINIPDDTPVDPVVIPRDLTESELKYSSSYGIITNTQRSLPSLVNPYGLPITYDSSKTAVATVNSSGNVNEVANGKTAICAIFSGNSNFNKKTVSYNLTVNKQGSLKILNDLEFGFTSDSYTITEDGQTALSLNNIYHLTSTNTSSNESVAKINSNGAVTVYNNGTTTIKAVFAGNSEYNPKTDQYTLTVNILDEPVVDDDETKITRYTNDALSEFNSVINTEGKTLTRNHIRNLVKEAYYLYFKGNSKNGLPLLYTVNNFPNIYNFWNNTEDSSKKDGIFKVCTGWLCAMQLAELDHTKRTDIFKVGYEYGGYTISNAPMYGYAFKTDPNVARLVASSIYSALRRKLSPNISSMMSEVGGSKYGETLLQIYDRTKGVDVTNPLDLYTDLREFMNSAPGPYDLRYNNRLGLQPTFIDTKVDNNCLLIDMNIHNLILNDYNWEDYKTNPTTTNNKRVIQAIADKDFDVNHMFGEDRVNVAGKYAFNAIFGKNTLGLALIINTSGDIASFTSLCELVGETGRKILFQEVDKKNSGKNLYGRLRPGCSWEYETMLNDPSNNNYNALTDYYIENNDGHPVGYYDKNGNYIIPHDVTTIEEYEDTQRKNVYANSYPSGHSSGIWAAAMALIEIYPDKADKIMIAANNVCVNRTICRYHWNSDTIQGRVIATIVIPVAHATSDYDTLLNSAIAEAGT